MREGAARAEAGDGAALPAVVGPCQDSSIAQSCPPAQCTGRRAASPRPCHREACLRDRRCGAGPPVSCGGGDAGRGSERQVACSKLAMANSHPVRLSSGSRVARQISEARGCSDEPGENLSHLCPAQVRNRRASSRPKAWLCSYWQRFLPESPV